MIETFQKILGKEVADCYLPLVTEILENKKFIIYHFMSSEEFQKITEDDPSEGNSQYMKEILYRAHFASISSLARNIEWLKGMKVAYENGLYLPFASSMRSLIESTADSFDALVQTGVTIAEHNKIINQRLNKQGDGFITISELEEDLIHYSHARKIEKGEQVPKSHKAKTAAEYVRQLDQKTAMSFYECYGVLCQLTHPAAQGVLHMMPSINDSEFTFEEKFGKEKIDLLLSEYHKLIPDLLSYAFNPGLLTLKVLNYIDLASCHTDYLKIISFDAVPAWARCKKHLAETCT